MDPKEWIFDGGEKNMGLKNVKFGKLWNNVRNNETDRTGFK